MNSNLRVSKNFINYIFVILFCYVLGFNKLNALENNSSNFYQNLIDKNKVLIKKMDLNLDSIKDVIVISENNNDSIEFRTIYLFLGDNSNNYSLIDSNSKMIFDEFGATRNQLDDIEIFGNSSIFTIEQCIGWSFDWHSFLTLSFEINSKCDFKLFEAKVFEERLKNENDDNSEWVETTEYIPKDKIQGLNFHYLNSDLLLEDFSK